MFIVFLIYTNCVVWIHTTILVLCKLYYKFIQFLYKLYSTNSYKMWFFGDLCLSLRERKGEAGAHLLPWPGRAWLPQPLGYFQMPRLLGYTRQPRPLGYTRLPRLLGYTRLTWPLGYTRLPRLLGYTQMRWPVRVPTWGGWVRNGNKVQFVLY